MRKSKQRENNNKGQKAKGRSGNEGNEGQGINCWSGRTERDAQKMSGWSGDGTNSTREGNMERDTRTEGTKEKEGRGKARNNESNEDCKPHEQIRAIIKGSAGTDSNVIK